MAENQTQSDAYDSTSHFPILVVEDNPIDQRWAAQVLHSAGFGRDLVRFAKTLAEAGECIASFRPAVVMLDMSLPDSQGIETLRAFRKMDSVSPIVVFSGTEDELVAIEALRHGAQDYLVKGSANSMLALRSLRYALERHQMILERRELEQQILQMQKLEAIGRLAGGIAHEFNNLLMVIRGHSELLHMRTDEGTPARASVEEIQQAADSAAKLTRQLLAFSRQQASEPAVFNLNDAIRQLENILRMQSGKDIEVSLELAEDLLPIRADAAQISQVIINLAANARDAMKGGGLLCIRTSNVSPQSAGRASLTDLRDRACVCLEISDAGSGMDKGTLDHMFEPFFTTKEFGKNTGLGLATVYGLIEQNHGHIFISSEPGLGTHCEIYFGAVLAAEQDAAPATSKAPARQATILVADDEPAVRSVTARFLELEGYRVLQASGGKEALALLQECGAQVDLVITDMVMPSMTGRDLAEAIHRQHAPTKVLFVSGYAQGTLRDEGLTREQQVLHKPFNRAQLTEKVRSILAGAGASGSPPSSPRAAFA